MSLKELWKNKSRPTISFELFPGRDEKAQKKLVKVIDSLIELAPDFVSVTFGAGGHSRAGSLELARMLKHEKGLTVLPYLAAYGLGPDDIVSILDANVAAGLENLFCIRGDQPEMEDFQPHPHSFAHASDFLEFVNGKYSLFTGAAGYPEGHKDGETAEESIRYVKLKVEKGARFIICQFVYDTAYFFDFVKRCRAAGIGVPILAGVMPIYAVKMTENLVEMCGASLTPEITEAFAAFPPEDKNAATDFGVQLAIRQCRELINGGADGIHFYTMDRAKSIVQIMEQLKEDGLL